jgi:hypothetical protein
MLFGVTLKTSLFGDIHVDKDKITLDALHSRAPRTSIAGWLTLFGPS